MRKKSTVFYLMMSVLLVGTAMAEERGPIRHNRAKVQKTKTVTALSTPVVKDATDVTDAGFTANWEAVEGADGYAVYASLKHKAIAEEDYYLANEGFEEVPQGTLDNPTEGGEFVYLDEYTDRCDWEAIFPMYIDGALGLDNTIADLIPGTLYSPYYDLSHDGGKVTVNVTMMGQGVSSVEVCLYNEDGMVESKPIQLTSNWKTYTVEFAHGEVNGYIGIMGNKTDFGIFYIDDIKISQHLKTGEITELKYSYGETEKTFYPFFTPDKVAGDSYAFQVRAYALGETKEDSPVLSDFSEFKEVINPNGITTVETDGIKVCMRENLHVVLFKNAMINIYSANGVRVAVQNGECGDNVIKLNAKGLYLVEVGDKVYRVIK